MADLFNLIRANLERSKPKDSNESIFGGSSTSAFDEEVPRPRKRMNLEDLIIGEEERKYKQREKSFSKEADALDEEFGEEKDKPNVLSTVNRVDFVKLDQLPIKSQVKDLKREYLNLLDALEEANKQIGSLEKNNGNRSVELHQIKKETSKLQDVIRIIAGVLPDGVNLKKTLESANWKVSDIEEELIERVKFVVDRVKNIEVYVEKQMEEQLNENKVYKKKLVQYEAEFTKLEDRYNQAVEHINKMETQLEDALGRVEALTKQASVPQRPVYQEPVAPPVYREQPSVVEAPKVEPVPEPVVEIPKFEPKPEPEPVYEVPRFEPEPVVEVPKFEPIQKPKIEEEPKFDRFDRFEEIETPKQEVAEEEEEESGDGHILLEIDRYLETLPDSHKLIIKTIGEHGVSRNQELREVLEEIPSGKNMFFKGNKFSYQDMSAIVKTLRDGGFLDAEKVKLGSRGGYNFTVYELTNLGKAIYKSLSGGKKAVVSEKKLITNQHASLEHGFLIKDCAQIFREMDYTVYTERKDLTVKLPDGRRKDFDIIIEKDGNKQYIEVERGTHTDEDFFEAMDKIYQVTNEFYFIAPNEEKLFGKTKVQVFKWIKERLGGMDKAKGKLVVHFATFEKIKKKLPHPWETIKL